jgi:hypothetical protein
VLYHEDIDLTKMNNLAKVEEEQHKNRYLSYAEQQSTRKSDGEFSLYTHLLLETTMMKKSLTETVLLSPTWKRCESIFKTLTGFNWYI